MLAERLTRAMSEKPGTTKAGLARAARVKPPSVSGWFSGKTQRLAGDNLLRAAAYLGVRPEWLASGSLPMYPEEGETLPAPLSNASPSDYIRFELLDAAAGMGEGYVNDDFPEIVREIEMAVAEVRRRIGFVPRPGRIKLLTGRGESMSPLIENGDVLMIDTTAISFTGDGVYLINLAGVTQVKLLQVRPDGIHVISANPAYMPYLVPHDDVDRLLIGGKVVSAISIRAL